MEHLPKTAISEESSRLEPTISLSQEMRDEIVHWVLSHQAVGETIVSLNPVQRRTFNRVDKVGMVYLPNYLQTPFKKSK